MKTSHLFNIVGFVSIAPHVPASIAIGVGIGFFVIALIATVMND